MSDFCKQCAEVLFGEDTGDLRGISSEEDTMKGLFANVLCEGCGATQVDHTGKCIHHEREQHDPLDESSDPDPTTVNDMSDSDYRAEPDQAWQSEAHLRDMEGYGDYEGPRTWP